MVVALHSPTATALLTSWRWQPIAIAAVVVAVAWYAHSVRRLPAGPRSWPRRRSAWFAIGCALFLWSSCGFLGVYDHALFSVWTTQTLILLLLAPAAVMAGQVVELSAQHRGGPGFLARTAAGRVGRFLGNPLVGPAVVPILSAALFFGPVPGLIASSAVLGWLLQLVVMAVGAGIVLPLVTVRTEGSSLAIGLALLIGSFELVMDAVPGVVLRLSTRPGQFFAHWDTYSWSPAPLHDQRLAGSIVWGVAELLDLPFLVLIFWRWLRVDAQEAADVDVILDAERIARGADRDDDAPASDPPWWLSDPRFRER